MAAAIAQQFIVGTAELPAPTCASRAPCGAISRGWRPADIRVLAVLGPPRRKPCTTGRRWPSRFRAAAAAGAALFWSRRRGTTWCSSTDPTWSKNSSSNSSARRKGVRRRRRDTRHLGDAALLSSHAGRSFTPGADTAGKASQQATRSLRVRHQVIQTQPPQRGPVT